MKKILATLLAMVLVLALLPAGVVSAEEYCDGYYYSVTDDQATITGYVGRGGDLTIPSTLGGYPVVTIDYGVFMDNNLITAVVIPDCVTSIGEKAFDDCDNLQSVFIGDGAVTIGQYAFNDCDNLQSVFIGDGAVTIGQYAFYDCDNLQSVVIGDGAVTIGKYAFSNCGTLTDNLQSVVIGDGAVTIGQYAFYQSGFQSVVIGDGNGTIGSYAFAQSSLQSADIGDGVTSIGTYAFYNCYELKSVVVGDSVNTIDQAAFVGCYRMTAITLPKSLNRVNQYAFSFCDALKHVYYTGSAKEKTSIKIDSYSGYTQYKNPATGVKEYYSNEDLTNATWHYYSCSDGHTYEDACATICSMCYFERVAPHDYLEATCLRAASCRLCGVTTGSKADHIYSGDCDEQCDCCGESRAVEHVYTNWYCDESCSRCGAVRTAPHYYWNDCDTDCDLCGAVRTVEHVYKNDCDADCNRCGVYREVGEHIYTDACDVTCDVCGAYREVDDHIYTNTCDKTCNRCGHRRTITHQYSNTCDRTCNVCGEERTITHQYSDEYCDADCDICGEVRTAPHIYFDDCDIDCNECGTKRKAIHTYSNACDPYCNVCGDYRENTHKYTNNCDRDCNLCGEKRDVSHKYTNKCDSTCNECGSIREVVEHTYTAVLGKKATTSANGYYKYSCKECGVTTSKTKTIYKVGKVTLSNTSYIYDGKVKKPAVTVKDSMGNKITTSNYTVTYATGCKNVGTYKVTIKMKGKYAGTKTLTFTINPVKTTVKATAATKSLKLTIGKKSTQVTGYEVQYATSKSFKSYKTKTLTSYTKTSLTLTGLKAKTTYYVRVRTYKTVNGEKIYSGWSTIVYKKTK